MAEKNNATCSICGSPYYLCLSCKDTIKLSPWKIHTDTAEHFKVFQIIKGFSTGVYTKNEAKEKFKNIDLKDMESFRPHIQQIIKDILKEEKKAVVKTIEKVEDAIIVDVEETENIAKPIVSRKRNYKSEAEVE